MERQFFRKRSYKELKLTDQIQKITERIIKKWIRQQVKTDEMYFGFMSGCEISNAIFILTLLQEKYLATKKKLKFGDLEKAFD